MLMKWSALLSVSVYYSLSGQILQEHLLLIALQMIRTSTHLTLQEFFY